MPRVIELSPSKIRFMQNKINSNFSNEDSINETITKIENGVMDVYDLPLIRVVRKDGFYYAFDNRRLYVYRVLHHRGLLDKIKVKVAPLRYFQQSRFTTENNGESIELARGRTLHHSEATSPPSSPETFSDSEDESEDYLAYLLELNLCLDDDDNDDDDDNEFGIGHYPSDDCTYDEYENVDYGF